MDTSDLPDPWCCDPSDRVGLRLTHQIMSKERGMMGRISDADRTEEVRNTGSSQLESTIRRPEGLADPVFEMDQCCHDVAAVTSLRANMAAAARTLLQLIIDAMHQTLLSVYYLFNKACWEIHHCHRGALNPRSNQWRSGKSNWFFKTSKVQWIYWWVHLIRGGLIIDYWRLVKWVLMNLQFSSCCQ